MQYISIKINALNISTFNMLAAVHRSMPSYSNRRESEKREWWEPRAEAMARFVAEEMAFSDVVLLQEWWFGKDFEELFDSMTGHVFERVAERRPGGLNAPPREDGMAVLVKKEGKLELCDSHSVLTGPQRIGQIVTCREKQEGGGEGRPVLIGNVHLSFPGGPDPIANARKQAFEAQLVARALNKHGQKFSVPISSLQPQQKQQQHLQIIGGDFNSNSSALAATQLETPPHYFVNCASATADQALNSGSGGRVNLGVTHHTHRGENVSVDHIFARSICSTQTKASSLRLGYLDSLGTKVTDCRKIYLDLKGSRIISDHRPVTATFMWPKMSYDDEGCQKDGVLNGTAAANGDLNMPLDPLQPPWGF